VVKEKWSLNLKMVVVLTSGGFPVGQFVTQPVLELASRLKGPRGQYLEEVLNYQCKKHYQTNIDTAPGQILQRAYEFFQRNPATLDYRGFFCDAKTWFFCLVRRTTDNSDDMFYISDALSLDLPSYTNVRTVIKSNWN
jgi:hypothetical protein